MNDSVRCPSCGAPQRDLWDYDWDTREELLAACGTCGADYNLSRHVSVSYEAHPDARRAAEGDGGK